MQVTKYKISVIIILLPVFLSGYLLFLYASEEPQRGDGPNNVEIIVEGGEGIDTSPVNVTVWGENDERLFSETYDLSPREYISTDDIKLSETGEKPGKIVVSMPNKDPRVWRYDPSHGVEIDCEGRDIHIVVHEDSYVLFYPC